MKRRVMFVGRLPFAAAVCVLLSAAPGSAQLGQRPAQEWIKTLDVPHRVATMRIPEIVEALKLRPGQMVADIGAGSGLFEVPLARAVGPTGKVYAVDIDAGFFPEITRRASEGKVTNVVTVLGKFADPALPVKNIDVAFFNDVVHHIENRAAYLETLTRYLAPGGRVAIVDFKAGKGPHSSDPTLEVSREQLVAWMREAGMKVIEDVKLFDDRYFLIFGKR